MGDYRKLEAWQQAHQLALVVYRLTADFPSVERFGLVAQMRRSALSVSANLAEGCGRESDAELRRFTRISLGSLAELESEAQLAVDLQLIGSDHFDTMSQDIHAIRGKLRGLLGFLSQGPAPAGP